MGSDFRPTARLSKRSIEALLDLLDIKLSCMQISDREDAREAAILEFARRELSAMSGVPATPAPADEAAGAEKRRGRPRLASVIAH